VLTRRLLRAILAPMRLAILLCVALQDDAGLAESIERFRAGEAGSLEAVVSLGESAVPALLELLADVEERSVTRFGLLAALADRDFNVRRCSSLAITWLGDARA